MQAPINTEALQEKWAPLLNAEGQEKITDPHRKMVTAVLLENQEKALREEREFLTEQPTNTQIHLEHSSRFLVVSASSPVAGFDPVLISLIRRAMPNLVAYDLAGVQPMNGPTGLIFAMRSRLDNQSGDETFYNEVDSAFSGQNKGEQTLLEWLMETLVWVQLHKQVQIQVYLDPTATAQCTVQDLQRRSGYVYCRV